MWAAVVVLAAVAGVDPVESLIGTVRGSGLVLLLCTAALVAMAPSLPEGLLNPGVRLLAADVELLLRNFPATQAWIRDQLATFPHDSVTVPAAEPGLTPPG